MVNNSSLYSTLIREQLRNRVLFEAQCFPEDNEKYPAEGKRGVKNERKNGIGKLNPAMEDWRGAGQEHCGCLQIYKGCHGVAVTTQRSKEKIGYTSGSPRESELRSKPGTTFLWQN